MTNIQIAVKVRPLIERELRDKVEQQWLVKDNSIVHTDSAQNFLGEPYSFDHIFDQNTSNKEVYDTVVKPLVMSCLEGINSTIFAYGQTSSGKTHTMLGDKDVPGIIIFTVQDIFKHIEEATNKNFLLRCSYLEIYNEKINDLLDTKAKDLKIREDYDGVRVSVKEEVVRESSELFMLMKKGMKTRKIGCTDMNERSSRSHTIFKLIIQSQSKDSEGSYTESSLSLVDLAGSERVGQMKMKGERQAEGVSINKSLTTLGLVIRKLSDNEPYINYRDSKLTRLLQHSLGGNSKTLIICTITVAAVEETKSTLEFAQRAKYVKNTPIINERVTDKDQLKQYENMCQDYKGQIERLRLEKLEREKTINALEDKICNIKMFTSGNFGKSVKTTKIPQRRHTLGVYKPCMKNSLAPVLDDERLDECDEDDTLDIMKRESNVNKRESNVNSDADKENVNLYADTVAITPAKWFSVPKTPQTPKTPSPVLRQQKELLEDSYNSLKTFTSHENQLRDQYDEIKELKELTDKLRTENINLREQNIKEGQKYIKVIERNKEIYDQLILLRSVLEAKPKEEIRRRSLLTIMEDDFEMISDQRDPTNIDFLGQLTEEIRKNEIAEEKCLKLIEENKHLKKEFENMELIFNTLNSDFTEVKEKHVALTTQNEILKSDLESKNMTVAELKKCISDDRNVKEAELEILTKKIKNLNDYKEEMHKQLSDLQKTREELAQEQNTTLQKELESLKQEYEDLKQLTEYDTLKIGDLEEENQTLKSQLETKADLEEQLVHLREKIKSLEEMNKQLSDLQKTREELAQEQNTTLQKELESLRQEYENLKQLTESDTLKIGNLLEENQTLKSELETKADLEEQLIHLREKIKSLEAMNKQLLDLQKTREELAQEQNTTLQKELESLRQEYENLKQSTEYDTLKIGNLVEENQTLKSELETMADLQEQLIHLREKIKSLEEAELEISDLRLVVQLQSQTIIDLEKKIDKLKSNTQIHEEKDSPTQQLAALKETLTIKENRIKELEEKYAEEFNSMKEKYEALELDQLDMEKKVEDLTQCKLEYKSITNHMKAILGEDFDIIDFVNMIKILKDDNDDLRRKLESSEKQIEALNSEFDMNKKTCGSDESGISSTLALENETLKDRIMELEKNNRSLQKDYDECLLKINDLKDQTSAMKKEITEYAAAKDELTVLMNENTDLKQTLNAQSLEIVELTKKSANLQDDLEKNLTELVAQKKENDALRSQLANYLEETNQNSTLQKENERLKIELEDISFQLSGEQKEVEKLSQQVEEKLLAIVSYEKEILHLNNQISKLITEKSKESNMTLMLKKNLEQKEAELKNVEERYQGINQENTKIKHQLEEYKLQLDENNFKLNNLNEGYDAKNNELKSLDNQNTELKIQLGQLEQHNSELKDTCHSQELQLEDYKGKLNSKSMELENKIKLYNDIKDECLNQEQELQSYKDQLNNKILEVNEKSELYNNILTTYAAKDEQIIRLEMERTDLKSQVNDLLEQQLETKEVHRQLAEKILDIKNLESERADLQRRLESHVNLQQTVDNYLEDFSNLKATHDTLQVEHSDLKNQLKDKNEELKGYYSALQSLDVKTKENECLVIENKQLKNQLTSLTQKQILHDALLQDMENLKLEKSNLTNRVDELSRDNVEINLQVSKLETNLSTKQEEIKDLRELLEQKSVEMKILAKDKDKISAKMELALKDLIDMKRTLDKRSEELSHLKGKYNALEVQFHDCKDSSKSKIRELEKQVKNAEHLNNLIKDTGRGNEILLLEKKNTELTSQLESVTLKLNQTQDDNKLKIVQLRTASEEIQRLKQSLLNFNSLQNELEQYKMKLQKIHKNYEGNITFLKNTVTNLTQEKQSLEKKLADSESKVLALTNELAMEKHRTDDSRQLEPELRERVSFLEAKVKLEKSKTESLTKKLRSSEAEVNDLQVKVNDLVLYRKKMQDKLSEGVLKEIPVPRLSDEGRPLSPNELRKIKRQSIHDQRRGLVLDSSDSLSLSNQDCPGCQDLRNKYKTIVEKNKDILEQMENMKKNSELVKWENENLTKGNRDSKIRELEGDKCSGDKIINCLECKEQKARCSRMEDQIKQLKTEIEELKKETIFLDKENEDMLKMIKEMEKSENDLHNQLQKCKTPSALEKELLHNKKLIIEYKNRITDLESNYREMEYKHEKIEKELERKLSDYQCKAMKTSPDMEDKGTQATCDLLEKYKQARRVAQMRRHEGNYLRAKLNLPPDCPVLPEDLQRQPTSV